jgi:hypothetical protein
MYAYAYTTHLDLTPPPEQKNVPNSFFFFFLSFCNCCYRRRGEHAIVCMTGPPLCYDDDNLTPHVFLSNEAVNGPRPGVTGLQQRACPHPNLEIKLSWRPVPLIRMVAYGIAA